MIDLACEAPTVLKALEKFSRALKADVFVRVGLEGRQVFLLSFFCIGGFPNTGKSVAIEHEHNCAFAADPRTLDDDFLRNELIGGVCEVF